jgi:hypothetical protein
MPGANRSASDPPLRWIQASITRAARRLSALLYQRDAWLSAFAVALNVWPPVRRNCSAIPTCFMVLQPLVTLK